jgi:HEAT repeat protein
MRTILAIVLATNLAAAGPKPGDEGTPEFQKAAALVQQLGDKRFATREAAAKELIEMGGAAVQALRAGTRSSDQEVRNRSTALLPKAVVAEWDHRATAWLADRDGKQKHELPLLAEFEKTVGPFDAGSRKIFADMLRSQGPLMESVAADRKAATLQLAARTKECLDQVRVAGKQLKAPTGEIAALLFVHSIVKEKADDDDARTERSVPAYLLANPSLAESIKADDIGPAVRRLLVRWIDSRPKKDTMSGLYFSLLVYRQPFPEAIEPLVKLAKEAPPVVRVVAPEAIGKIEGKPALDALTSLLDETSIIYPDIGGADAKHRVCDCALAALANRAKRPPTDFGMISYLVTTYWFGGNDVVLHVYGFRSMQARKDGLKKWKDEGAKK